MAIETDAAPLQAPAMLAPAAPPVSPNSASDGSAEPSGAQRPPEFGGPKGLEPTRYGDWERKGRCIDF